MSNNLHPLCDADSHDLTDPIRSAGPQLDTNISTDQLYRTLHYPSTPYNHHPNFDPTADAAHSSPSHFARRPSANPSAGSSAHGSITPLLLPGDYHSQGASSTTLIDLGDQHRSPGTYSQPNTPPNLRSLPMASQHHHVYLPSPAQYPMAQNHHYQNSSSDVCADAKLDVPKSLTQFHHFSVEPTTPSHGADRHSPLVKKLEALPVPPTSRRKRLSNTHFVILALLGCLLIGAAIGVVCYVHKRRAKVGNNVVGDDGDVIAQSGLGSARNGTVNDDGDLFGGQPPDEPAGPSNGLHYDSLVVFGASYCDNAHARPSIYHGSLKPKPYFKGRWTDGYVWNEYLAQMIGPGGGRTMLVNYAYGGATVDNTISSADVPDFRAQVHAFESDLSVHSPGAGPYNGKALLTVWVGINSITKIWNQVLKAEVKAQSKMEAHNSVLLADSSINDSVDAIFTVMANLSQSSAFTGPRPDILLLPIPPEPLLPVNVRAAKGSSRSLETLGRLNDVFNNRFTNQFANFQSQLSSDQRVFTYDIPGLWHDFTSNPSNYGLSVVDQPCLAHNAVCPRPNEYLYWDALHPTTYIHHKLAILLRDVLRS